MADAFPWLVAGFFVSVMCDTEVCAAIFAVGIVVSLLCS